MELAWELPEQKSHGPAVVGVRNGDRGRPLYGGGDGVSGGGLWASEQALRGCRGREMSCVPCSGPLGSR